MLRPAAELRKMRTKPHDNLNTDTHFVGVEVVVIDVVDLEVVDQVLPCCPSDSESTFSRSQPQLPGPAQTIRGQSNCGEGVCKLVP